MPRVKPKMTKEESQILFEFLTTQMQNPQSKEWFPSRIYPLERADGTVHLKFNYAFILRERTSEKPGVPCDIVAQEYFSKGTYGYAYLASTVTIYPDRLVFKEKGYLLKVINLNWKYTKEDLEKEYSIMKEIKDLHAKPPTISSDQKRAYLAMRKLPGVELVTLEEYEEYKGLWISLPHKLSLCIEILKAVKSKFADKGIVHGDLSNNNILVLFKSNRFTISLIDCGRSFKKQAEKSYLYSTSKKDISDLGKLFSKEIWPSRIIPLVPETIGEALKDTLKAMRNEDNGSKSPEITLELAITNFETMYADIKGSLRDLLSQNCYVKAKDLEKITKMSFPDKTILRQQSPLSRNLCFFTLDESQSPRSAHTPFPFPSSPRKNVPILQLPFFPYSKTEKAESPNKSKRSYPSETAAENSDNTEASSFTSSKTA